MQIRILGPVDVIDGENNNVAIGGPMQVRLLALLVGRGDAETAVDDIIAELWPTLDRPADPVSVVRTYIARLRTVLGRDIVKTRTGAYVLGDVATDADRFESLVEHARRASGSPTAAGMWRDAIDLWRGPAFGEHGDLDATRAEATRLGELRAEAIEAFIDARIAAGEGRELAADVEAAVAEFPLREGFRAQQMTVLARAGRQADALRAFQIFRGEMTEIGLEPSARMIDLDQEIAGGSIPTSGARRTLRGYELGERIGQGAFAQVWSATQASVGRPVAIKQIRAELANQPEFIRQFESEAQLVARLEHPHIVPLYDYWREPGSAYLVMRYLEGGSLASQLLNEPLELEALVPMVSQVASALDVAHRSGVVHRDVKPANILVDDSHNAYLSDFGIAVEEAERLDPEAWLSNGSPAYAPPEQLQRRSVGPTADVYALGVTVYESLTGQIPFPTETTMAGLLERQLSDPIPLVRASHPAIPAAVDAVIQLATSKRPEDRYQSAGEFAANLAAAAGIQSSADLIQGEDRNPYKGLAPFGEADASDFTGRDRLVSQLLDTVAAHRLVVVVGPSGSGKSSVVRAGLLPALRNGRIEGSRRWFVASMIPDADPFADLETALLSIATDPPKDLSARLRNDANGLARAVRQIVPEDRELVLVIDQFEELFTTGSARDTRLFLDSLVTAVGDDRGRLRVVATLRADFYDQPLRHAAFANLIRPGTVAVPPLAADELERTITEPAAAVGARFESGLVAQVTADVADQPGALPLLQYTLTELFERREGNVLTRAAYDELGGVSGSIARRADALYLDGSESEQRATRSVLGRLVSLGDGTEDTRRRGLRSQFRSDTAAEAVITRLGQARLLSFDRDGATREQTVDIAHEALIREWPRLRGWLDDDRDDLRVHQHVTAAASGWDSAGRPASELYRGVRLEAASEWQVGHQEELTRLEQDYLAASEAQRRAEDDAEKQRLSRLRRLLTAVAAVAAIAVVAGGLALAQRNRANDEAERASDAAEQAGVEAQRANTEADRANDQTALAEQNAIAAAEAQSEAEDLADSAQIAALVSRSLVAAEDDVDVGLLLAREASDRRYDHASQGAVLNALSRVPVVDRTITESRIAPGQIIGSTRRCFDITADNRFLFGHSNTAGLAAERIEVDPRTGNVAREELSEGQWCLQFVSPDGRFRVGPREQRLELTDVTSGDAVAEYPLCDLNFGWARDGRFIHVLAPEGSPDPCRGPLQLSAIDPVTLEAEALAPPAIVLGGQRSKFDRWLNIGVLDLEEGVPRNHRWDLQTLTKVEETPMGGIRPIDFNVSAAGDLLLITQATGPYTLMEPGTGRIVAEVDIPVSAIPFSYQATMNSAGDRLAIGTRDGFLRVIDPFSGNEVSPPIKSDEGLQEVLWVDDTTVSALMASGEVRVFDLASSGLSERVVPCCPDADDPTAVRFDAAVTRAVVTRGFFGNDDDDVSFVDLVSGESTTVSVPGATVAVPRADGSALVISNELQGMIVSPGGTIEQSGGPPDVEDVNNVGYAHGRLGVLSRMPGRSQDASSVFLFEIEDPASYSEVRLDDVPGPLRRSFYPMSNGNLLFGRGDGTVMELDADAEIVQIWTVHGSEHAISGLEINTEGLLLSSTVLGAIAVTDLGTAEVKDGFATGGAVVHAAFGPPGSVITIDFDGRTRLWDIQTQREIGVLHPGAEAQFAAPAMSADGSGVWLALGTNLTLVPTDAQEWLERTCRFTSRELTESEWSELVPGDEPYRPICG